jgi:zinc transporter ZupT
MQKLKNASAYLSLGTCFGSGIILGAAFSHMVPEAMEGFETFFAVGESHEGETEEEHHGHGHAYPWPMFIAVVVLLLLITADIVASSAHDKMMGHSGEGGHQNHMVAMFNDKPEPHNHKNKQAPQEHDNKPVSVEVVVKSDVKIHAATIDQAEPTCSKEAANTVSSLNSLDAEIKRGSKTQVIQAYIFFVALSLHAITDGLSLGAEDGGSGFYGILVAVVVHKALDGFALGVPLFYAKLPKFHTIFAIIFCSLMTPLGIGIGLAATNSIESSQIALAQGIVLSISMGSFIFIALWEMLPAGLHQGKWLAGKLAAVFLGWGIMALLAKWV